MSNVPVQPGDILASKYRVERVLGVGGMGVVVLATHVQVEERVALKFMLPGALADAEVSGRFLREARLAVKLKSEHVAKVMDVGTLESGSPYIVMEYLEGQDLNHLLEKHGPLPFADVAEYVIQACDAIAEAHLLGIVHRDLKPANLFLSRRADGAPLVKVLDFGISKANPLGETGGGMTRTSTMMGSPYFMSPEQMRSAKDVDGRSDVWSMGVVLYQLLTARLPFESDTLGGIMAHVLQDDPSAISTYRPDVPHAFEAIVRRCLERDLRARAHGMGEIAMALAPYAPARARPIADRIVSLVGTRTGQGTMILDAGAITGSGPITGVGLVTGAPVLGAAPVTGAPAVTTQPPVKRRGGASVLVGALVVGSAVAGGAYLWKSQPHAAETPKASVEAPAVTAPAAPAASTPAGDVPPTTASAEATPAATATVVAPVAAAATATPRTARRGAPARAPIAPVAPVVSYPAPSPPKTNPLDGRN